MSRRAPDQPRRDALRSATSTRRSELELLGAPITSIRRTRRDRLDRRLAVRGRVADVLAARRVDRREAALSRMATISAVSSTDKRGLGEEGEIVGIGRQRPLGVLDRLDQGHRAFGHLAERADHLGMAGMADEQDVAPVLDQPLGLAVDLGDERAGGVEIVEAARLGLGRHRLGHAVGGEDHRHAVGHLVELVDEDRALRLQPVDDELVVDDLVADIDRRAVALERQLDDPDGAVDPGAEAARRGDQQGEGRRRSVSMRRRCKASLAGLEGASYDGGQINCARAPVTGCRRRAPRTGDRPS